MSLFDDIKRTVKSKAGEIQAKREHEAILKRAAKAEYDLAFKKEYASARLQRAKSKGLEDARRAIGAMDKPKQEVKRRKSLFDEDLTLGNESLFGENMRF